MNVIILILIVKTTSGSIIECLFDDAAFSPVGKVYQCEVATIDPGTKTEVEVIEGNHQQEKNNSNVGLFYISRINVQRIPRDLEIFFPNLEIFYIAYAGLQEITADDLKYPNLKRFTSLNNKLRVLESDLFKFTPKLRFIHIFGSPLSYIGEGLFSNLPELVYADLRKNDCVDYVTLSSFDVPELNEKILPCYTRPTESSRKFTDDHIFKILSTLEALSNQIKQLEEKVEKLSTSDGIK